MTRIKICCIQTPDEARLAVKAGAGALGLVSEMPSGPGVIPEKLIREIARQVPQLVATVLLTSRTRAVDIIDQQQRCRVNTLQLVDRLAYDQYSLLRASLPGITLIQVVHVVDDSAIADAERISPLVDALLLDSGKPGAAVRELGGTGRVHNWNISRRIREQIDIPVYLAGGLRPDNVRQAIELVNPFGVDVCSGVRTNGRLDEKKLHTFINAVRRIDKSE